MNALSLLRAHVVTAWSKEDVSSVLELIPGYLQRLAAKARTDHTALDPVQNRAVLDLVRTSKALADEVRDTPFYRITESFVQAAEKEIHRMLMDSQVLAEVMDGHTGTLVVQALQRALSGIKDLARANSKRGLEIHDNRTSFNFQFASATVEPGSRTVKHLISAVHRVVKGRIESVRDRVKIVGIPGAYGAEIVFKAGSVADSHGEFYVYINGGKGHGGNGFYARTAEDVLNVARKYEICR